MWELPFSGGDPLADWDFFDNEPSDTWDDLEDSQFRIGEQYLPGLKGAKREEPGSRV